MWEAKIIRIVIDRNLVPQKTKASSPWTQLSSVASLTRWAYESLKIAIIASDPP